MTVFLVHGEELVMEITFERVIRIRQIRHSP